MSAVIFRRRLLGNTGTQGVVAVSRTGLTIQTHRRIRKTARREGPWPDDVDMVIRWGCTAQIPVPCNTVVNRAEAISRVNDKSGFRALLFEHDLCPPTWVSPGVEDTEEEFVERIGERAEEEVTTVIRPRHHAQGRRFYVCNSMDEVRQAARRCGAGWYASDLIDKVAEYRVFVASGRAVWVARKTPGNPNEVAWNVARGGRFDNVRWDDWPLRVVKVAIEGFNLSGLDFGGVDVIVDADGTPYIVEINSAPSQTSPYRQQCTAQVLDYIVENGKDTIPLIEDRGGYRKFIHPAINKNAQLP